MDVNDLLNYWRQAYYTIPIAGLVSIVGIIVFLSGKRRNKSTYIFIYYFVGYVILMLTYNLDALYKRAQYRTIPLFIDYLFTMFEFFIFLSFFKKVLHPRFHKTLKVITYLFTTIGILIFSYNVYLYGYPILNSVIYLFNLQAVCMLIPCTIYYLEVFRLISIPNLLQEPSFWIVTGLSFVLISTLPLSLFCTYLHKLDFSLFLNLFSLFYLFYSLLFLMIIKGHLCK